MEGIRFVIITGLSGAGKSQAVHSFEDLGYFCIDNLPPMLISKFAELAAQSEGKVSRIALVSDIRAVPFSPVLWKRWNNWREPGLIMKYSF